MDTTFYESLCIGSKSLSLDIVKNVRNKIVIKKVYGLRIKLKESKWQTCPQNFSLVTSKLSPITSLQYQSVSFYLFGVPLTPNLTR